MHAYVLLYCFYIRLKYLFAIIRLSIFAISIPVHVSCRYSGKVISLKQSSGAVRIKVKFDLRKQDKFDKW